MNGEGDSKGFGIVKQWNNGARDTDVWEGWITAKFYLVPKAMTSDLSPSRVGPPWVNTYQPPPPDTYCILLMFDDLNFI